MSKKTEQCEHEWKPTKFRYANDTKCVKCGITVREDTEALLYGGRIDNFIFRAMEKLDDKSHE